MKKLTLIVSAIALLIGFSQCKKDEIKPNNNGERIQITLNANYGGNGSKTTFDPEHGSFAWASGTTEYINVGGSTSGYLGQLQNDGEGSSTFTGEISIPDGNETLYFFYLGNGDHAGATTLDFSNQSSGTVTDYHIAIGSQAYTGQTEFSATLNMTMAIAYFDLNQFKSSTDVAETVYIHGDEVYATATIDYNNGVITGDTKGFINVGTANTGKYVALIPSVTTSTTVKFESNTKTGSMTFLRGIKPASYYSNNSSALAPTIGTLPEGATPGLFTVAGEEVNGNKISTRMVRFSKGNLQYQASSNSWQFAPTQYTSIGNAAGNNVFDDNRKTQEAWIDLFGWGTSGWNNGNTYYQPYDYIGTVGSSSAYGYGPKYTVNYQGMYDKSLVDEFANADWGVYNNISNGGTGWRTLTGGNNDDSEWKYLIETRSASTVAGTENARFFKTKVNNINGLVILPDVYVHPTGVTNPTNINVATNIAWPSITLNYTLDEWANIEAAGAIFLPCTGYRSYSSNNPDYTSDYGCYWSSTVYNKSNACCFFIAGTVKTDQNNAKRLGYFVRLVKDVK